MSVLVVTSPAGCAMRLGARARLAVNVAAMAAVRIRCRVMASSQTSKVAGEAEPVEGWRV